jgi:predicted glycosyltransferase
MRDATLPTLLFYCQHSLGVGHLTRSFALVQALTRQFRVVFLNGGRLPPGVQVPTGIVRIDLPPLGMDDGHTVVSRNGVLDVQSAQAERRRLIGKAVADARPAVLLVELFPFGRKKFANEILPMIRAARSQSDGAAKVVCSLRDILVDARPDQRHHDDRARWLADRYFDAVIVHADPAFARIEDSFHPTRPMHTPVFYSGYVVPTRERAAIALRGRHLLVSAGGGIVGDALFRTTLAARTLLAQPLPIRLIAGPFLPEPHWQELNRLVRGQRDVELVRHVPDMVAEMRAARASLSQCGYNTALDLVVSGVPALVVPYETATENEQSQRAERLAAMGAMLHQGANTLRPDTLATSVERLLGFTPRPAALALDGAERSSRLIANLLASGVERHDLEAECETI